MSEPRKARGAATVLRVAGLSIVCVLVWLTHMLPTARVPDRSLDLSWTAGIGHALWKGWQAGTDYVFTFGPLGYFATDAYVPELFWIKLVAWDGIFGLLVSAILTLAALRIRGTLQRSLYLVLLVVQIAQVDSWVFLAILAIAVWVLDREEASTPAALLGLAILAVFPWVKFSFGIPAGACALAIAASHGKAVSRRRGAALLGAFLAMAATTWLLAGQSLANLPIYLLRSIQMSTAYGESMSTEAPEGTSGPALAVIVLFLFLAALHAADRPRRFSRIAVSLACVPWLWIAYQSGFVRASDHTVIFFNVTLVAPLLLSTAESVSRPWRAAGFAARLACVGLSVLGLGAALRSRGDHPGVLPRQALHRATAIARTLLDPASLRSTCEEKLESARKAHDLPRTRAAVGGSTIDMVSCRQGVLLLNDLNWHPRPVFQGYATLTADLMEANARFYRSERASEFVLSWFETIDRRLPAMDDALALQVLARDYEPVLDEKGYLLLRRAPRTGSREPASVDMQREIAFGETLDLRGLEGRCHVLRLDLRYSLWGRLRKLFEKPPVLLAQIDLDTGETMNVRIVPGMLRAGVIIDPLLRSQVDWRDWYLGETLARPKALKILPSKSPSLYRETIGVTVLRDDGIAPLPRPDLRTALNSGLLEDQPSEVRAALPPRRAYVGLAKVEEALLLPAPSEMSFDAAAGPHVLRIQFGFVREAWARGRTDGATFSVVVSDRDGDERVLFERFLDPARVHWHRELKSFEIPFELAAPARLLLRTGPGPRGDATDDLTGWSMVSLD